MRNRTSLILKARRRGSCYRDGKPFWTQGKRGRPCRTAEDAEKERLSVVKLLRRYGRGSSKARKLARRIKECAKGNRCLSGACPVCLRAYQRLFVSAARKALTGGKRYRIVSIVPVDAIHKEGQL
jgi:hypothetical protein